MEPNSGSWNLVYLHQSKPSLLTTIRARGSTSTSKQQQQANSKFHLVFQEKQSAFPSTPTLQASQKAFRTRSPRCPLPTFREGPQIVLQNNFRIHGTKLVLMPTVTMDAKAVTERSKALQKAIDQGEPPETLVKIIKELNKGVNATEELLRMTKIGSVINRLKTHKDQEVSGMARETVNKWRAEVQKKRDSMKAGQKPGTPKSGTGSPAPGTGTKSNSEAPTVKPENRTWKTDKVDIHRTSSEVRDRCVGMVYDGLVYLETKPSNTILNIALAIEEAAFKKLAPETSQAYREKMRELFLNLKNKNDASLRVKVLLGEITPNRLVEMTTEELKSKKARKEEEEIRKINIREAQMPQAALSVSDHLECGKCKNKKVSYTQAQTRSADEPMTTFCTCTVCGNRWKFS